jgi:hypothetical protein
MTAFLDLAGGGTRLSRSPAPTGSERLVLSHPGKGCMLSALPGYLAREVIP